MILEAKAASIALPTVTKVVMSAGQLIFAGVFLAIGFQTGHKVSEKVTTFWEFRKLAKIERELLEEEDEG